MQTNGTAVEKWNCYDVQLDGDRNVSNPFRVKVTGCFTGPDGQSLNIPGFYNGDGKWVVRFAPTCEGIWSYNINSDMDTLNGQKGKLVCIPNTNPNIHGKLGIHPNTPRHFQHEDGSDYFMIGYEADWLFALDLDAKGDRQKSEKFLKDIAEHGFNHIVMNVYAHDVTWDTEGRGTPHDYSSPPVYPFGGTNDVPNHGVLNVDFFKHLDGIIASMQQKGLAAHLMIYVWNKKVDWPDKNSEEDNQYFDYIIARYQAFSNIVWDISKEALSYGYCSDEYITGRCRRARDMDAYSRLLTVHDAGYCKMHPEEIDIFSIQTWTSDLYHEMREVCSKYKDMPVYNIEHGGYERSPYVTFIGNYQDPIVCLERNYQCVFAGAYSTYYWQGASWNIIIPDIDELEEEERPKYEYFEYMQDYFDKIEYHRLTPADHHSSSGYCLADEGKVYLFFKPYGGTAMHVFHLKDGEKSAVEWFNPVTGETIAQGFTDPSEWREFVCPWGKDMAVLKLTIQP